MRTPRFILALMLLALVAGCRTSSPSEGPPQADPEQADLVEEGPQENVVEGLGTIRYMDLEGGFYGLVAEDGTQYQPLNLEEAYEEDGLRVRFRVRKRDDVMTIRMWGQPVDILALERVDK